MRGDIKIADWKPSENPYDWLGKGIYFWERNKRRARQWAAKNVKGDAAILRVELELGKCLDLADSDYLGLIRDEYDSLVEEYRELNWKMPANRKSGLRDLDRLVIDRFVAKMESVDGLAIIKFDTVCAPFEEGDPIFPGSLIRDQSHVQIAVRNYQMIHTVELVE
ncbi:hypothetical protein NA78x_000966 [Anatilimnocola sp. NA78]|uniref:hypothetical protein n=1 Tax=Anatilimnocola sp. NA78 TaxID=3415683 RepID=UPI003CE4FE59